MPAWTDYKSESDTRNINLTVSRRTQSILLSALSSFEGAAAWQDWETAQNEIERAVDSAALEVIDEKNNKPE